MYIPRDPSSYEVYGVGSLRIAFWEPQGNMPPACLLDPVDLDLQLPKTTPPLPCILPESQRMPFAPKKYYVFENTSGSGVSQVVRKDCKGGRTGGDDSGLTRSYQKSRLCYE